MTRKIDLPLFIRIVDAKRHDSVSAIVSLCEFSDLYPSLNINAFISDSTSDNYATYELLEEWDISAVIALGKSNNGNSRLPVPIAHDNGTPICPGGHKMVNWGATIMTAAAENGAVHEFSVKLNVAMFVTLARPLNMAESSILKPNGIHVLFAGSRVAQTLGSS